MEDCYVFVDKGTPDGDYTAKITVKAHEDETLEIVSCEVTNEK